MKKKILGLVVLIFLTSGCTIEYNLSIDKDNNLVENFNIEVYASNDMTTDDLYYFYTEEYPIYNDEEFMYYDPLSKNEDYTYYDKSYQAVVNGYIFRYQAEFSFEDYLRARSVNTAFTNFSRGYLESEDCYYLSASSTNLFTYNANLERIIIHITFEGATVLSNNADSVSGNTYTWTLERDDDQTVNIRYQLDEEDDNNEQPDQPSDPSNNDGNQGVEEEKNNLFDYILLGAILVLFFIAIIGLIKYKSISSKE